MSEPVIVKAKKPRKSRVSKVVRTNSLELLNEDGKVVATLKPVSNGAGLWINGPDGRKVAVYSIDGQTAIGIYNDEKSTAMDLALSISPDGVPFVQFTKSDGSISNMNLEDIKC